MRALLIDAPGPATLAEVGEDRLPGLPVLVRVSHSTLNYKDALAVTGQAPVVRRYPMVPGIDLAGTVESSSDPSWRRGDELLVNGWGLGELHWGGLAEWARLEPAWLTRLPPGMSPARAMAIGTAGFTAMLAVMALEQHGVTPARGDVLVTGAAGGVGGIAVQVLSRLGYRVTASTGRLEERDYLERLGASDVIDRHRLAAPSSKPLASARWAGAIDSVGSHTLANVCAQMQEDGVVAACGLAQGMDFPATVAPFILRAVTLVGINSVFRPAATRDEAWRRLARDLDPDRLDLMTRTIGLAECLAAAPELLAGRVRGRLVVDTAQ